MPNHRAALQAVLQVSEKTRRDAHLSESFAGLLFWPYAPRMLNSGNRGAADPSDSGIPPQLVRMNRFTERTWVLHGGVTWYSPEERAEIAQEESQEIRKRCGNTEAAGAFSDRQNRRIVELKGYAFPCQ